MGTRDLVVKNFGVLYDFAVRAVQSTRYVLHKGPANQRALYPSRDQRTPELSNGFYRNFLNWDLAKLTMEMNSNAIGSQNLNWLMEYDSIWQAARYAKSGTCVHYASGVLIWALRFAHNIRATIASHTEDHVFCIFSSHVRDLDYRFCSVVVDSWVHSHPVICLPSEHYLAMNNVCRFATFDLAGKSNVQLPEYDMSVLSDKKREVKRLIKTPYFKPAYNGTICDQGTNWNGTSFLGYQRHIDGRPFSIEDIAVPLPPRPAPGGGVRDHVEYVPGLPPGPLEKFPQFARGPRDELQL
ncbi:MAG: hypothetical protein AAF355_09730 [Myxococcota bacterium]